MSYEVNNGKRTALIRAYLPPSTMEDLLDLTGALTHSQYQNPTVLGDLNNYIKA